jgi:hypothetical protein
MSPIVQMTTDPPLSATVLLAERARQASHLARGGSGQLGASVEGGAVRAVWCRRDSTMRSFLGSIMSDEEAVEGGLEMERLLDEHRPDGAIIRMIGSTGPASRITLRRRALYFSLGVLEYREILPLPATFDIFLASLGRATRSHARNSLRDFDRRGFSHTLTSGQPIEITDEIRSLSERNMPSATPPHRLMEYVRDANAQDRPFQSAVHGPDGRLISVIIGYVVDGHAMLICQFNPHDAPKIGQAGCSLLHRALLIRRLIGMGVTGLIVINGCNGMLRPYCLPVLAQTYLVVSLRPISWLRCAAYVLARPYLWAFVNRELSAGRASR